MVMARSKVARGGNQGGVKGIRKVCQLTEKCDGYERGVRMSGKARNF